MSAASRSMTGPVDRAEAGQRVAVALTGAGRDQLARGLALVEPDAYAVTRRLDGRAPRARAVARSRSRPPRNDRDERPRRPPRRKPFSCAWRIRWSPRRATGSSSVQARRSRAPSSSTPRPSGRARRRPCRARSPRPSTRRRSNATSRRPADGFSGSPTAERPPSSSATPGSCGSATGSRSNGTPTNGQRRSSSPSASTPARSRSRRFRDLLGESRRTAQLVLERLDGDGVTLREGDRAEAQAPGEDGLRRISKRHDGAPCRMQATSSTVAVSP